MKLSADDLARIRMLNLRDRDVRTLVAGYLHTALREHQAMTDTLSEALPEGRTILGWLDRMVEVVDDGGVELSAYLLGHRSGNA